MTLKSILLAAAASLIVAAPAMAQDAMQPAPQPAPEAAPAPQVAPQPAPTPPTAEQAAIEAAAQAFHGRMDTMTTEIKAAIAAAGPDMVKAQADSDAVVERYAPEMTAFADRIDAFFDGQIAASTDEQERVGLAAGKQAANAQIRNLPGTIKAEIAQQLAVASAPPATVPVPAEPAPTTPPVQ